MASRALHACVFVVYACAYVCVSVCVPHKVKQPLNKFESVTHWGLPSPSISADRMACLCSMHAAHCGLQLYRTTQRHMALLLLLSLGQADGIMCVSVCVWLLLVSGVTTKIHSSKFSTFAQSNGQKWNGWQEYTHTHNTHTHNKQTQQSSIPGVRLKND